MTLGLQQTHQNDRSKTQSAPDSVTDRQKRKWNQKNVSGSEKDQQKANYVSPSCIKCLGSHLPSKGNQCYSSRQKKPISKNHFINSPFGKTLRQQHRSQSRTNRTSLSFKNCLHANNRNFYPKTSKINISSNKYIIKHAINSYLKCRSGIPSAASTTVRREPAPRLTTDY